MFAVTVVTACSSAPPEVTQLKAAVVKHAEDVGRGTSVAFRFAGKRGGGDVRVYRLPDLDPADWRFNAPGLVAARVVGFDGDDDLLYVIGTDHRLVAVDLDGGRPRTLDSNVANADLAPSGTPVLSRDDSTLAVVAGRATTTWATMNGRIAAIWGTTGGRIVAVVRRDSTRRLVQVAASNQKPQRRTIPEGPIAVATWGDAAAVGTDSGVVLFDLLHDRNDTFIPLKAAVTAVAFSASGHRVYAARADGDLMIIDRFEGAVLRATTLPGIARDLRPDPLGRVLLASPGKGDSVWVISLHETQPVRTVIGSWDRDLPTVAPDGVLLLRRDDDVVALSGDSLRVAGRVRGGAADRWLTAPWDPRRPPLQVAQASGTPTDVAPNTDMYVQVSSTSNASWANDLAGDLRAAGLKASVLAPSDTDEMYRVVIGPFTSHDEAEATGQKLGMPFWIFTRTPPPTTPTP